jgi:AraC family transcriptional regulator
MHCQPCIRFLGANERPLSTEALNQTVLYSTGLKSTPIVIERNRFVASEFHDVTFAQLVFIIHLSRAINCEYKQQGSFRRFLKSQGAIGFFPSGEPIYTRLDIGKGVSSTDLLLALDPGFVTKTATRLEIDLARVELIQQRRKGDPALQQLALALQNAIESGDAIDVMYCEALSTALTLHPLRQYGGVSLSPKPLSGGLSPEKLRRALAYIQDRLSTALTVSEIAEVAGVSRYYYNRLFKASTGQSPYQYVVEARVRKAKELLATGKFTIGEVANEVGFFDQSHLTRHFKRIFGLPPKTWLNSVRRTFPLALGASQASVLSH